jgi:hypothetical protein
MLWSLRLRRSAGAGFRLIVVLCLLGSIPAQATEVEPPPVGQTVKFACEGDFDHEREHVVRSVVNGIIRDDVKLDGSPGYVVKPYWLNATSLYQELNTAKGTWQMTGVEAFSGMRSLKVGSVFRGGIVAQGSNGSSVLSVTETVSEERQYQSGVLGNIHVIVVEEARRSGNATSFARIYYSPEHSTVVFYHYSASDGKHQECNLAALRDR